MLQTARTRSAPRRERRPYFSWSTAQLEEVARVRWDDGAGLRVLRAELGYRTRLRAVRLASRVDERLQELASCAALGAGEQEAPTTDHRPAGRTFEPDDVSVGVLAAAGYRVGRNGVCTEARRRALTHIVEHEITDVDDPAYLATWGRPGSVERLRRTANVLAKLARGARTRGPSMTTARVAWSRDLAYLRERYYDGHYEHAFTWPSDRY
ncbi:MAG: hypothetical protein ACNA8R_15130 [Nitriliruptoraceae bacterium]